MHDLDGQQNSTDIPAAIENLTSIIHSIDDLIIDNKVQMIDITLNEEGSTINDQDFEEEEVECEVKPDTSTSFIR